ncbi:MAG: glycoside hydrolase/phage tail family protein [Pseudomonadota bacterium]
MAQLVLTAASGLVGAVGKIGVGSIIARTAAATAAGFAAQGLTNAILGPTRREAEGPRLETFSVQASTEGAGILRVWGRARVAGQIIWAARFKETSETTTETSGGKGGPSVETTVTEYAYSISFAVGLCEGPIDRVGRVWADGRPLDLSKINARIYYGTEDQGPDDLILAVEGAAPAFRGLAYVVFEDLPLADFGNRIPQLSFEVERSLTSEDPGALENALTAVTVIPSSGEFVYGTTPVRRSEGEGVSVSENKRAGGGGTDFSIALDSLQALAGNVRSAALVVSWFGDDLRAGSCRLRPGVETPVKTTEPYEWSVGGVAREAAFLVSQDDGAAVYGGTPSDRSVLEAIADMNARGLDVLFHPFILMDVPPGNGLPDPYGGAEQSAFPWRGRIVSPSDGAAGAGADIAAFFGAATAGDFSIAGDAVSYAGPDEWSFRRFVLHYAHLCALAGGVEAFILGSELRGLTTTRDAAGAYPAVDAMKSLAAEVRAVLGPVVKISYGADWSEYFGHQPTDGSGDVSFHLDPLWSDPAIDFIGVDNYLPLADWRDEADHLDALAGAKSQYDLDYLKAAIRSGERYDWYYASDADRAAQIRSPIMDGAYGEDWVFRPKDLWGWWENPHHNRPGGVRSPTPTSWVPRSKPFRFTELGCSAIDKGANQPNVFVDPKSSESATPHFSTGARDDLAQRRFLEAHLDFWRDPAQNPTSPDYGGPMVAADRLYVYAIDARPFPFFPALSDVWGDAANWSLGHWLNGRLGRAPLDLLIGALSREAGPVAVDTSGLQGVLTGYVLDRPMSPRASIEPLAQVYQFDMVDAGGALRFQPWAQSAVSMLTVNDLVAHNSDATLSASVEQLGEAPSVLRLGFIDEGADYQSAVVEASEPGRIDDRVAALELPLVVDAGEASARARALLADAHVARESARFRLPLSRLAMQPGDAVDLEAAGVSRRYRIVEVADGVDRRIEAVRVTKAAFDAPVETVAPAAPAAPPVFGPPLFAVFDAPLLREEDDARAVRIAAFASPWPGRVSFFRRRSGADGYGALSGAVDARATIGVLDAALDPLPAGASGRFRDQTMRVRLSNGAFSSVSDSALLAGANGLFIEADPASGGVEVVQFRDAVLGPDGVWTLSRLLRGQAGTEDLAVLGAPAGARVALIDQAIGFAALPADEHGLVHVWRAGPANEPPATSDAYAERETRPASRALSPLSPVHLKVERTVDGWRLNWIRRTRIGGDAWERDDAPLGEAFERYRVEIVNGVSVVRSDEIAFSEYFYSAVDAQSDFGGGGPSAPFLARVAQISDFAGPGVFASAIISL